MTLHYTSNRVEGYQVVLTVPASGDMVPSSLKRIVIQVNVAGRTLEQMLDPLPNQVAEIIWDGLDHLGSQVSGTVKAHVNVGFVYDGVYWMPGDYEPSFGMPGLAPTGIPTRQEVTLWKRDEIAIDSILKSKGFIAEGWTLSYHHHLSPMDPTRLYKGDGTTIRNNAIINTTWRAY